MSRTDRRPSSELLRGSCGVVSIRCRDSQFPFTMQRATLTPEGCVGFELFALVRKDQRCSDYGFVLEGFLFWPLRDGNLEHLACETLFQTSPRSNDFAPSFNYNVLTTASGCGTVLPSLYLHYHRSWSSGSPEGRRLQDMSTNSFGNRHWISSEMSNTSSAADDTSTTTMRLCQHRINAHAATSPIYVQFMARCGILPRHPEIMRRRPKRSRSLFGLNKEARPFPAYTRRHQAKLT